MKWKKPRFQKILSLLMTVVMCLSVMQGTVWASELIVENDAIAEQVDIAEQDILGADADLELQDDSDCDAELDGDSENDSDYDAELDDDSENDSDCDAELQDDSENDLDCDAELDGDSENNLDCDAELQDDSENDLDCDAELQGDASEKADTIIIEDIRVVEEADELDSEEYTELPLISETYINPIYEDVLTEDDLVQPDPYVVSLIATSADYETYENAVGTVRSQLKSRNETVGVMVKTTRTDFRQIAHDLMDDAMVHNGIPTEGDYLRWMYGGWSVSISIAVGSSGTIYYLTYTYTVTYHATADQEAEVTAEIASLLPELGLTDSSKSDYEKVKIIYDYICGHVTYDYENLNNGDYKLKFTAYAALMNGTAVCQGYALLFYRLALECGIDARLIAGNNNTHAWNIAKVGNRYYNLDATWDSSRTEYAYCLKCTSDFGDHIREAEYDTSAFHAVYPMGKTNYLESEYQVNSSWTYDNGILVITDAAVMSSYESADGQPWYALQNKITEVIIENDITHIGAYAFAECTALTAVTIGEAVTEIGSNAFEGCTALSKIVISDSITNVAEDAFSGADAVKMVLQPDGTAYDREDDSILAVILEKTVWGTHDHLAGSEVQEHAVAATCAAEGSYEAVTYCTVCLAELERTTEVIAATGNHTEKKPVRENVIAATCKDGSYDSVIYCLVCKQELSRTNVIVEATEEHTEKEAVKEKEKAATCTADGSYEEAVYCSVCGEELSRETKTITAQGHTVVTDAAVAATCTAPGKTEGSHCAVCSAVLVEPGKIPAVGHTTAEAVKEKEKAATCTVDGSYEEAVYCSVCGEELSRETKTITAQGHTAVTDAAVAATCTASGKTEGSHCQVCKAVLTAQKETAAIGHRGEWITTADATVFAPEQQSRICTVCGEKEIREAGEPVQKFISLNAGSLRLRKGQTTGKFAVSYGNGDSIASLKLSRKNIVKVTQNKDGSLKIKALKKTGSVKLKVTLASRLSKTITIKVVEDKIRTTSLKLAAEQKKVTVKKGSMVKLLPIIKPITSQDKVKFTSSNKKVATVTSGGVVKGRKKGTAKITIRSGKEKVVCTVRVK